MADYKKPDHWQLKARKEGYPARSVYKLKEIDEKFVFFKNPACRVLDLGAAPGSWSLYVLRRTKGKCFLAAADLSPLSQELENYFSGGGSKENFFFIQGDIFASDVRDEIFNKGPYLVILSDAAPATTGSRMVDAARSLQLAEEAVNYAENSLTAGGFLALKVFQGSDSAALLKRMKSLFKTVKSFKPLACRGESVETYFIGLGKKAPNELQDNIEPLAKLG
ncbi:MAG: RlmE family RNA methyltransferase [Treponema sp.]|nr:RlmE family RNA methyltransferase [Treponema sp.]MCL2272995.1 RlmE family RNA methyltransferase [Treponema sp.]